MAVYEEEKKTKKKKKKNESLISVLLCFSIATCWIFVLPSAIETKVEKPKFAKMRSYS